ncbi:MAG TPA: thioredoxin family protein [Opitutaceae bacterium]|nr:thioredoxin family protein [Opitutaceae bacterium]
MTLPLPTPTLVSRTDWLDARRAFLAREKQLTQLHEQVMNERRALPWVRVEKDYRFRGSRGEVSLADLFSGRSQLVVYHFMLGPDWDQGCKSCSFLMDHVDGARRHFEHHDLSFAAVSRAPWQKIDAFQRRMQWTFPWVSSFENDFNRDFHVSFTPEEIEQGGVPYNFKVAGPGDLFDEMPGASVFVRDAQGTVYHTYSTYTRGLDFLIGAHHYLDLTPKGRNERHTMDWVRHHDRYETAL